MSNLSRLKVGEMAWIYKGDRKILLKRIATSGFRQFLIVKNERR